MFHNESLEEQIEFFQNRSNDIPEAYLPKNWKSLGKTELKQKFAKLMDKCEAEDLEESTETLVNIGSIAIHPTLRKILLELKAVQRIWTLLQDCDGSDMRRMEALLSFFANALSDEELEVPLKKFVPFILSLMEREEASKELDKKKYHMLNFLLVACGRMARNEHLSKDNLAKINASVEMVMRLGARILGNRDTPVFLCLASLECISNHVRFANKSNNWKKVAAPLLDMNIIERLINFTKGDTSIANYAFQQIANLIWMDETKTLYNYNLGILRDPKSHPDTIGHAIIALHSFIGYSHKEKPKEALNTMYNMIDFLNNPHGEIRFQVLRALNLVLAISKFNAAIQQKDTKVLDSCIGIFSEFVVKLPSPDELTSSTFSAATINLSLLGENQEACKRIIVSKAFPSLIKLLVTLQIVEEDHQDEIIVQCLTLFYRLLSMPSEALARPNVSDQLWNQFVNRLKNEFQSSSDPDICDTSKSILSVLKLLELGVLKIQPKKTPETPAQSQIEAKSKSLEVCNNCGSRTASKKCSKCRAVYYCSVECQHENWPRHKEVCKST